MKKILLSAGAVLVALFTAVFVVAGPSSAQDDGARIHLIHGIPGVDVDVEIAGEVAVPGFQFQDTQDLSSFAGQTLEDVQVKVAGTDDVAIDIGDLPLPATGNVTAIAHLDADGNPTATVFTNDTSTLDPGEGRLVVRHTAAAPAVDVLAGGEAVISNLPNGEGEALDLPAGTVTASVVPAGETEPVVIGPADLPVAEGEALIVYAVGSLSDETITVLTESIEGLHGTPTEVNTGNSLVDEASSGTGLIALGALAASVIVLAGVAASSLRPARVEA